LGLDDYRKGICTVSLTEALGLSRERIVAWVKAGLIEPAYRARHLVL
jgi:hypothetical protein